MTRFFHAGREIGFDQAVEVMRVHASEIGAGRDEIDGMQVLVSWAEEGSWGAQDLLACAGITLPG
jgi:hypothetical protein